MKLNSIHKSIYLLFGALILFVGIGFTLILLKTNRESKSFKLNEKNLEHALTQAQTQVHIQEDYLKRFHQDPKFREWVARKRIGYARPDEIIFRFGDDDASDSYSSKTTYR